MTDIKKIIFSPNSAIDAAIKEMLQYFTPESQRKMKRAILNAKKAVKKYCNENTDASARHIFREFIPASILNKKGFAFEYEKSIHGKTPDWLDDTARIMLECYTYERGGSSSFLDRISSSITDKCNKYKDIVKANSFRFIVAVYLDFLTGITLNYCHNNIEIFRAIFDVNDSLWAILFFTEKYIIDGQQQYGFFCICIDSSFQVIPNWPFYTISLNN